VLAVEFAAGIALVDIGTVAGRVRRCVKGTLQIAREEKLRIGVHVEVDALPLDPVGRKGFGHVCLQGLEHIAGGIPHVEHERNSVPLAGGVGGDVERSAKVKREALDRQGRVHRDTLADADVARAEVRAVVPTEPAIAVNDFVAQGVRLCMNSRVKCG